MPATAIRPIGSGWKAPPTSCGCARAWRTSWRAVNARVAAAGLELFLFDAWRPRAVQAYFHDVWMPRELQRRDPSLTRRGADGGSGTLLGRAQRRCRFARAACHRRRGRSDLALEGRRAACGWARCSTMSRRWPIATVLKICSADNFSFSDQEARANRRLLHWLMAEEGFAGHPDEWWHFSWGDQMWAALTRRAARALRTGELPA